MAIAESFAHTGVKKVAGSSQNRERSVHQADPWMMILPPHSLQTCTLVTVSKNAATKLFAAWPQWGHWLQDAIR
jgi:hypothetical protein